MSSDMDARRLELENLWEKVFALVIQSGKSPSWAEHMAEEAVTNGTGSTRQRDFIINQKLKSEGFPVDQS